MNRLVLGFAMALCVSVGVAWTSAEPAIVTSPWFSPGDNRANVPVASCGPRWRLEVAESHAGSLELYHIDKPDRCVFLAHNEEAAYAYDGDTLTVARPERVGSDTLEIVWSRPQWQSAIAKFGEVDAAHPPTPGGVLFVGSSTIVGWDLERCFPGLEALNRGFGGNEYVDVIHYADQIILPYKPSTIVVYAGDNDVARGKSVERVFADFETLMRLIRHHLPEARVVVLSIKPSVARRALWDQMRLVNARMATYANGESHIDFVDIAPVLLGEDGEPRPDLLKEDGLHLNEKGYAAISQLVRPWLSPRR